MNANKVNPQFSALREEQAIQNSLAFGFEMGLFF